MPEDAWLLELGQMTREVIATYIEYRWYRKKGIYQKNNRGQGVFRGRRLEEAEWYKCPRQRKKKINVICPTQRKIQPDNIQSEPSKSTAKEKGKQREVRRIFKMLKEVQLNIGIEKVNIHEGIIVKVLLDSSITGMFINRKMAARYGFRLQKLKKLVQVRNVDSTNNSVKAITHQVEVNVYYKGHVKRIRIDVCNLEKTNVILGMLWL